jgi:hypothetical protein
MGKLFDASPGAWGNAEKPKVIPCPGCGKLVYADKTKLDEHFSSNHEKNVYVSTEQPGSPNRPRIMGLKWHQEIRMMLIDYPKGTLAWTAIVLVATLILSLLRFSA